MLEQAGIPFATKHPVELDIPKILCSELPQALGKEEAGRQGRQSECFPFRTI